MVRHQKVREYVGDGEGVARSVPALGQDDVSEPLRSGCRAALEPIGVDDLYPDDAKPRAQLLDRHRRG